MSCRHLRRVREKYGEWGFDGLHDGVGQERRVRGGCRWRMAVAVVEEVLRLYRDEYFNFSVVPEEANRFLKRSYIGEFNKRFAVESAEPNETAFVPCNRSDLDRVFSIQSERTVNRDNTVKFNNMILQIDKQGWRSSMQGYRVIVYQHFDDTVTIGYGPQQIGKYSADGEPLKPQAKISSLLERKKSSPFFQFEQPGHITC